MLVDAAKGLETQTRKLYSVCRLRGLPIYTFINVRTFVRVSFVRHTICLPPTQI